MNSISDNGRAPTGRFGRGLLAVCLICLVTADLINAQTPRFDQLREQFQAGDVFEAEFQHEYRDSYTGEETFNEGVIWIRRDQYRVEGDRQVMVVDGEISRVYDGVRNRLLISDYVEEDDDFAPSRMLRGVDDSYLIEEEQSGSETLVTLRSDDPFALFSRVEIRIDGEGIPVRIEAVDQVENILVTEFRGGTFLEAEERLFELNVPDDAERVDLRH